MKKQARKRFRRNLSYIMCIILVFTMLPFATATASTTTYLKGSKIRAVVTLPDVDKFNGIEVLVKYGEPLEYIADTFSSAVIQDAVLNSAEEGKIYINITEAEKTFNVSTDHLLFTADFTVCETVENLDLTVDVDDVYIIEGTGFVGLPKDVEVNVEMLYVPETTEPSTGQSTTATTVATGASATELPTEITTAEPSTTTEPSSTEPSETTTVPSETTTEEPTVDEPNVTTVSTEAVSTSPSLPAPTVFPTVSDTEPTESTDTSPTEPITTAPKLNTKSKTLKAGETFILKVKNAKGKVRFSSNNGKVAVVSSNGIVTAIQKGNTSIVARVGNAKLVCKVKVTSKPKMSHKSVTVKRNETVKVKIKGKAVKINNKFSKSNYIKITSKKNSATIKIKGIKKGKTTLKVTVNKYVTLNLKVKVK